MEIEFAVNLDKDKNDLPSFYLLQIKPQADGFLRIPVTQQAMANLFGVARPSVARALKEMEEEGVLKSKNKQVEILNKKKLMEYLQE